MKEKHETWFEEELEKSKNNIAYKTEGHIIEFTDTVVRLMKEHNFSYDDMATITEFDVSYIKKLLGGDHDMSIKTMVKIADALGCELEIKVTKIKE